MTAARFEELFDEYRKAPEANREAALRALRTKEIVPAPANHAEERWYTLKQTSEILGFHSVSLWRWKIPGHQIGGRRRYRLSEVQAFLLNKTEHSAGNVGDQ